MLALAVVFLGATRPTPAQEPGQTYLLLVTGLGGEPQYSDAYYKAAVAMADAARTRFGVPDSAIIYLAENPARDPARIRGQSTKANVEQALARLAERARPGDQIFILLIGHGSVQGDEARFNLPGPDVTSADFARLLKRFAAQQVIFVNAASASGDFVRALSGPNRVIITATKSGMERNETMFARVFVQAFTDDVADTDKDGRVSLLEAFTYARREVARAYEEDGRLLTEHAQLDDNGDGVGTGDPDGRSGDGALARRLWLTGARAVAATSDPRLAPLYAQRRELEQRVAALRARKASMDSTAYEQELEKLLVALAQKNQAIRAAEGGKP
jgi:hypothetical protein